MRVRLPRGPALVLRLLLPSSVAEPLIQEIEESFVTDRVRRGRLRARLGVWQDVLSPSVLRMAIRYVPRRLRGLGVDAAFRELRFALRSLSKSRGYTLGTIAVLALGMGLVVAVSTALHGVLLRNPNYLYRADDVVSLSWHSGGRVFDAFSAADYLDIKRDARSLSDLHAYSPRSFTVRNGDAPRRVHGMTISHGMLGMLGATPVRGRFFRGEDDVAPAAPVVVVAHDYWQRELGGRLDVVGTLITINDQAHEVIGVAPEWLHFRAPGPAGNSIPQPPARLFVPNAFAAWRFHVRQAYTYYLVGRLAPNGTVRTAADEVRSIVAAVNQDVPITVRTLKSHVVGYSRTPLLLVGAAVGLVLILALTNAASLVLIRGIGRQRELSLRLALGSGRLRAALPLVLESFVLAAVATVLGVIGALWLLHWISVEVYLPMLQEFSYVRTAVWVSVLLFVVVSAVLGFLNLVRALGLVPGVSLRVSGAMQLTARQSRIQYWMVGGQIAVSLIVMAGAATISRSIERMRSVDLGISLEQITTHRIALPDEYEDSDRMKRFVTEYLDSIHVQPGVVIAGAINFLPFRDHGGVFGPLTAEGVVAEVVQRRAITPGLLAAIGIDRISGRDFEDSDDASRDPVGILSATAARQLFGSTDMVERTVADADGDVIRIVGVVEDIRPDRPDRLDAPTMYVPVYQDDFTQLSVVMRHVAGATPGVAARTVAADIDPRVPVFEEASLTDLVRSSMSSEYVIASVLGTLALVSVIISGVGMYTVTKLTVTVSRPEIGMRMALGATSRDILLGVLRGAVVTGVAGTAVGLGAYALMGSALAVYLYEIDVLDTMSLCMASSVLLILSVVGSLVPAHRASRFDPMQSLRVD